MADSLEGHLTRALNLMIDALDPPPDKSFILAGQEVPWDTCCEDGGQAWVRAISVVPDSAVVRLANGRRCHQHWLALIGLGVIRCVHSLDDQGVAPSSEQMTMDGLQMLDDEQTLRGLIECYVPHERMQEWVPLGALGGCAGGEWRVQIKIAHCECPPLPDADTDTE